MYSVSINLHLIVYIELMRKRRLLGRGESSVHEVRERCLKSKHRLRTVEGDGRGGERPLRPGAELLPVGPVDTAFNSFSTIMRMVFVRTLDFTENCVFPAFDCFLNLQDTFNYEGRKRGQSYGCSGFARPAAEHLLLHKRCTALKADKRRES
jgi:hypothetical protein